MVFLLSVETKNRVVSICARAFKTNAMCGKRERERHTLVTVVCVSCVGDRSMQNAHASSPFFQKKKKNMKTLNYREMVFLSSSFAPKAFFLSTRREEEPLAFVVLHAEEEEEEEEDFARLPRKRTEKSAAATLEEFWEEKF